MLNSFIKKIGRGSILIILALVPILFLPSTQFSLEPLKIFLVAFVSLLVLLSIIIEKIKQNSFYISKNILVVSLGAIILSLIVSTIFSNNTDISLFGRQIGVYSLLGLFSLGALSFGVYTLFDDIKSKTYLFATLFVSSVATVVLHICAILIPFFPTFGFFFTNNTNTIGSMMHLGIFAVLVLISSVLVLEHLKQIKLYRVSAWIGLVSGFLLLLLINSALLFLFVIIFALIYISIQAISDFGITKIKTVSYPAVSVLILSILFLLIGGKIGFVLNSYFNIQVDDVRPSLSSTVEVNKDFIVNEPIVSKIFGAGVDRFETAWLKYRPDEVNQSQFWDTDFRFGYSFITSAGVTQGIVGLLVWLLFILSALYYVYKVILLSHQEHKLNFIQTYITFLFLCLLIIFTVYTPSFILLMLLFVFLGLFMSTLKDLNLIQFKEFVITRSPRISFVYIFVLVLFIIAIVYSLYTVTTQYASRVIFDRAVVSFGQEGNVDQTLQTILNANFIYRSDVYDRALMSVGVEKLRQILLDTNTTQEQASDLFQEVLQSIVFIMRDAVVYDSQSYMTRLAILEVYKNLTMFGVTDAKDQALVVLGEIEKLVPNNPTVELEKARIYTIAKEYDTANRHIQSALELKPNYVAAVFLLSQIQVERGEIDLAISTTRTLINNDRLNPNLHFRLGLLYYNQSKYQDSSTSFENALRLSPNFANARYFLGLSYYQNQKTSDAITIFENLNSTFPENKEVQIILDNMRAGRSALEGIEPLPETREELPLEDGELEENTENIDEESLEENGQD